MTTMKGAKFVGFTLLIFVFALILMLFGEAIHSSTLEASGMHIFVFLALTWIVTIALILIKAEK
jgi:hypothetical protein